jgi:heme-degrading monooxygenase HmoA
MYALVREATLRPDAQEPYLAARAEFDAFHAQLEGFHGSVVLDAGEGRRITVALWESEQAYQAATPAMGAQAERLVNPYLTAPSRVIYQGPVVADHLTTR